MIKAYFNYPTSGITLHGDMSCSAMNTHHGDKKRREVFITNLNRATELENFKHNRYPFASRSGFNGIWVIVDLANETREIGVIDEISHFLAALYTPFKSPKLKFHCRP